MQLINILQVALLASSQASAAPVIESVALTSSNVTNELLKRANPAPVTCGTTNWSLQSVQDAYDALARYGVLRRQERPAAGTRRYPQEYEARDTTVQAVLNTIPECVIGQHQQKYFEFPITDPVFASGVQGSQGADRVIAISPSPGQAGVRTYTYCMAVTHIGSSTNGGFVPCT